MRRSRLRENEARFRKIQASGNAPWRVRYQNRDSREGQLLPHTKEIEDQPLFWFIVWWRRLRLTSCCSQDQSRQLKVCHENNYAVFKYFSFCLMFLPKIEPTRPWSASSLQRGAATGTKWERWGVTEAQHVTQDNKQSYHATPWQLVIPPLTLTTAVYNK